MVIGILHIFAILCVAFTCGKLVSKLKLPAILGWLIAGIVFCPYLAGVMIGREIVFKKIASSGKQIIGITFVQSIGTFLFVSATFSVVFIITHVPIYLAFVFGGIALATAPAPALSIVNEYHTIRFCFLLLFLLLSAISGLLIDYYIFHSFTLNYLLIGMAFSATVANLVPEKEFEETLKLYSPLLNLSLVIVIVNLGMPLDYRLIAGAGIFTIVYILSRAIGKIGGAYIGGKLTKAEPTVTKYLGFTLLPHSGGSLVFTGIATTTLASFDSSLAAIVSGAIVAAAIINEIIAVIVAKYAFKFAGEIEKQPHTIKGAKL